MTGAHRVHGWKWKTHRTGGLDEVAGFGNRAALLLRKRVQRTVNTGPYPPNDDGKTEVLEAEYALLSLSMKVPT